MFQLLYTVAQLEKYNCTLYTIKLNFSGTKYLYIELRLVLELYQTVKLLPVYFCVYVHGYARFRTYINMQKTTLIIMKTLCVFLSTGCLNPFISSFHNLKAPLLICPCTVEKI